MAIAMHMIVGVFRGSRQERVGHIASLVMWFAAGAFTISTVAHYLAPAFAGNITDVVGGVATAIGAIFCKAV